MIIRILILAFTFGNFLALNFLAKADEAGGLSPSECQILKLNIDGTIGVGTWDFLQKGMAYAKQKKCKAVYLSVNSPGGSLQSTRLIVEAIISSPIPFVCLINPSGGHASSAGAILMQACHVASGMVATNIGAATPILAQGGEISKDLRSKLINDTVSWLEGIVKLRKRNLQFAKDIVIEAKSLTSEEAVKIGALDFVSRSEVEFLTLLKDRVIHLSETQDIQLKEVSLNLFEQDLRYKILSLVADPEISYLIFMASLGLLYIELTHPGLIAPGVIGGIGLILSLVAFHKLEVVGGGLGLLFLGIGLLVAELFVPSFGILGVGGIVSFVMGSLFLYDYELTGYRLPLSLIFPIVFVLSSILLGLGYLVLKSQKRKVKDLEFIFKTSSFKIINLNEDKKTGQVEVNGDIWRFQADDIVDSEDQLEFEKRNGLTLFLKKKKVVQNLSR